MSIELLRSLFNQRNGLKSRFEEQKKAEWEALTANLESQISTIIVDLRNQRKLKVAELGRMLGTSDYRTAKARMDLAFDEQYAGTPPVAVTQTYTWAELRPGAWTVTDADGNTVTLAILDDEDAKATIIIDGSGPLAKVFSDNPEQGYNLWLDQTQTQNPS